VKSSGAYAAFIVFLATMWLVVSAPQWVRDGAVWFMLITGVGALVCGIDIGPYWRVRGIRPRRKPKAPHMPRAQHTTFGKEGQRHK